MPKYMEISPVTLNIVKTLYNLKEGEEITQFKLTKKVFPHITRENTNLGYHKLNKILRGKDITVHNELLKLEKLGIIHVINHKRGKEFELLDNKCYINKFKFPYDNKKSKGIALKVDGLWNIFQV